MQWFYITTPKFTCAIAIEDGTIKKSAPILDRFVGQPILNLMNWLDSKFEDYKLTKLEKEPVEELKDV